MCEFRQPGKVLQCVVRHGGPEPVEVQVGALLPCGAHDAPDLGRAVRRVRVRASCYIPVVRSIARMRIWSQIVLNAT